MYSRPMTTTTELVVRSDQAWLLDWNRSLCREQGAAPATRRNAWRAVRLRRSLAVGSHVRRLRRGVDPAIAEDPPLGDAHRSERDSGRDAVVLHRLHGHVGVLLLAARARLDGQRLVRRRDFAALDDSVLPEPRPRHGLRPCVLQNSIPLPRACRLHVLRGDVRGVLLGLEAS